jgi:hypothetical protein
MIQSTGDRHNRAEGIVAVSTTVSVVEVKQARIGTITEIAATIEPWIGRIAFYNFIPKNARFWHCLKPALEAIF